VEAGAVFNNLVNQAILRTALSEPTFRLTTRLDPFPLTYQDLTAGQAVTGFLAGIFLCVAIGFIPASVIAFIIKEKSLKAKHQQ
jgi:hypothetical protein